MNPVFLLLVLTCGFLVVYSAIPGKWQNLFLLLASYGFVGVLSVRFLVLLLIITLIGFVAVKLVGTGGRYAQTAFWVGLVALLLFLLSFRFIALYLDFPGTLAMVDSARKLNEQVWFPIGLSFYVLQAISILVDTHRGQWEDRVDFVAYALYLAYFPKFLAGPIERPAEFLPQLAEHRVTRNEDLEEGFTLVVLGLVRKIGVGDILRNAVPVGFVSHPEKFPGSELWMFLLLTVASIYFDFSGYTNIARGLSRCFGIRLSKNFDRPFSITQIWEFWNRWHMTFSRWIRDYVYFPLTRALLKRSRGKVRAVNIVVPVLIAMLASAAWHGIALNFWIWGLVMGVLLGAEHLWNVRRRTPVTQKVGPLGSWLRRARVFLLLLPAGIPFLVPASEIGAFVRALFDFDSGFSVNLRVLVFLVPGILLDVWQGRSGDELIPLHQARWVRVVLLALAVIWIGLASQLFLPKPFIYQGF